MAVRDPRKPTKILLAALLLAGCGLFPGCSCEDGDAPAPETEVVVAEPRAPDTAVVEEPSDEVPESAVEAVSDASPEPVAEAVPVAPPEPVAQATPDASPVPDADATSAAPVAAPEPDAAEPPVIDAMLPDAASGDAASPSPSSVPDVAEPEIASADGPELKAPKKSSGKKSSGKKKKKPKWKTSVTVGLETIYDDNFLRYSDDYLDDFHAGTYPYKFQIDRQDTHILAPSLDVYAQRKLLPWGNTRFRFKFKRWQYVQGNVKSNMGFDYYIRQYLPKGRSLEFWYNYAPQQYIRELSYRTPLQPPSDPLAWTEFRYSRNVFNLIFRTKIRKNMRLKLHLNRSLRYYNQEFMENDIKDLGLRGTLYWDLTKAWRLTLDYGFADAPARGANEVGEALAQSDDSDPSYKRDLFQIDIAWKPKWARKYFDKVSLRGQHQIYWFTSTKELVDDPYHVGRKDMVYAAQLVFNRKLNKSVNMAVGVKYTERVVDSPWKGDIAEDKDYNQRRYWIGLTYKL